MFLNLQKKIKQRNELNNTVIRQIQNMNFISIWPNVDQIDKCICEGKEFGSQERLTIKYRKKFRNRKKIGTDQSLLILIYPLICYTDSQEVPICSEI